MDKWQLAWAVAFAAAAFGTGMGVSDSLAEMPASRTGTITGAQIRSSLMRCGANGGLATLQLRKSGRELYATCGNGLAGSVEVAP